MEIALSPQAINHTSNASVGKGMEKDLCQRSYVKTDVKIRPIVKYSLPKTERLSILNQPFELGVEIGPQEFQHHMSKMPSSCC